jgi:lipoprotein-anchoring transpeptidase ErfK/SrfK
MVKIGRAALALAVGSVIALSGRALADSPEPSATEPPSQMVATSSPSTTPDVSESSAEAANSGQPIAEPIPQETDSEPQEPTPEPSGSAEPSESPSPTPSATVTPPSSPTAIAAPAAPAAPRALSVRAPSAIPGTGKRVFFDISDQQVWLVKPNGTIARTYLVSGSRYDQLKPGTYKVFSKSAKTTSWNSRATMNYMVRFTRGKNAAIGFHDIPRYPNGTSAQTLSQLGLPLSDGCIRQRSGDAKALWDFAPVGTTVVVTQ